MDQEKTLIDQEKLIEQSDEVNQNNISSTTSQKVEKSRNEDLGNIILLTFLYVFEGIPSGLTASIPLILSTRKVSYADQGTFSISSWPFSFKLLWAPIVDTVFIKRIGRRKTWACLCFFLIGLIMVCVASYVHGILQDTTPKSTRDIYMLTIIFGILMLLIATKDVCLDGWCIDLLLEKNVGWQGTCNGLGYGLGQFIGNSLFLTFESAKFCNEYLRPMFGFEPQPYGIITIQKFLYIFGSCSMLVAFLLLIFKNEHNLKKLKLEDENKLTHHVKDRSIIESYKLVLEIFKLPCMKKLILILLTIRVGLASENVFRLKLVEQGVEREKISFLSAIVSPILTLIPFLLRNHINGPRPLDLLRTSYSFKLLTLVIGMVFIYYAPYFRLENGKYTLIFYGIYFIFNFICSLFTFMIFVTVGAYFAQISDRSIGGTYMTFLAFWALIGLNSSRTATFYFVNIFTYKKCISDTFIDFGNNFNQTSRNSMSALLEELESNKCSSEAEINSCMSMGAKCVITFDGFYPVSIFLIVFAILWLVLSKSWIKYLQDIPKTHFLARTKKIVDINAI